MTPQRAELLRSLPAVSSVLEHEEVREWLEHLPRAAVVNAVQTALREAREAILRGSLTDPADVESIVERADAELHARSLPPLRRVINATGIVLHTGLGRAPLCDAAIEAIVEGASGYCNLEYDLATGQRGHRSDHIVDDLVAATGAESATVVNNNAAATLLILRTFAANREVLVSRGQLIEIGGSYRLPDIMRASGAVLREVGTTNRTRLRDYESAINDHTAMLLRVHTSNYKVVGFTESTPLEEMVALAKKYNLLAVDDLGSGSLLDLTPFGVPAEPGVHQSIAAGADLVCFSGDKLLGGPQCGIIVGKRELVECLERDHLFRTYRVDKLTLLALSATLRLYLDPEEARASIPALNMLTAATDELAARADALLQHLQQEMPPGERFYIGSDVSFAGGGSLPASELPTIVVQWRPTRWSIQEMVQALRNLETPVIVRVRDDAICFDLRTIRESEFKLLAESVSAAIWDVVHDDQPDRAPSVKLSLPIL